MISLSFLFFFEISIEWDFFELVLYGVVIFESYDWYLISLE